MPFPMGKETGRYGSLYPAGHEDVSSCYRNKRVFVLCLIVHIFVTHQLWVYSKHIATKVIICKF